MKRSRSAGFVCPLTTRRLCASVVRLYTCVLADDTKSCSNICTHLDTVLAHAGDDLSTVELNSRNGVLVPMQLGHVAHSEVPNLRVS